VVPQASGRAVCLALVRAMRRYGIPEEILSDNGKQFTDRFGKGREVLFDGICGDNGIHRRLAAPASRTTTGKVEPFQPTLRRELLDEAGVFQDLAAAQAAVDAFRREYNHDRPHQSLDVATPASRFACLLDGTYAAGAAVLDLLDVVRGVDAARHMDDVRAAKARTTWQIASTARMFARNLLPSHPPRWPP
jgi:hypothetical protein